MPLFQIQSSDMPMWVVARDWQDALHAWRLRWVNEESNYSGSMEEEFKEESREPEPDGIIRVADIDEVMIVEDGKWRVV